MFGGGICFDASRELVSIRDDYLENIVLGHVMPIAPFVDPDYIPMQDNAFANKT